MSEARSGMNSMTPVTSLKQLNIPSNNSPAVFPSFSYYCSKIYIHCCFVASSIMLLSANAYLPSRILSTVLNTYTQKIPFISSTSTPNYITLTSNSWCPNLPTWIQVSATQSFLTYSANILLGIILEVLLVVP